MSGFTINQVTLSGNLTKDPELRQAGDVSVCSLRIASNERYKDSSGEWTDRPGYYDVSIWRGMGEWVANHLHRGDGITVSGRLQWREWDTPEGQKRQSVSITADSIFPQRDGNGGSRRVESDVPIDTGDFAQAPKSKAADDDIPF